MNELPKTFSEKSYSELKTAQEIGRESSEMLIDWKEKGSSAFVCEKVRRKSILGIT